MTNLKYCARSESGPVRPLNEDCYAIGEGSADAPPGQLFVVCDGRGGPNVGDVAARLAADTIIATYYAAEDIDPTQALLKAFQTANEQIYHQWSRSSTRVTATAALAIGAQLVIANAGDCRAYHFHARQLEQITTDHTFYSTLIQDGMLTRKDVQMYTSGIARLLALGNEVDLEADVFQQTLQPGDAALLCTDGLHDYMEDEEIQEILATVPREKTVDRFIELVTERGGRDNVTAVLIWREI
ncbi:MAG TPA: protein phosphatase 2C domain-containing protein [Anaerolineae bacterium]|nr:protein phosphatase 2C domain-containing protein [Anaerolineae bacterium]